MTREGQTERCVRPAGGLAGCAPGLARLRATVTAAHETEEIDRAMNVIGEAGRKLGVLSPVEKSMDK